MRAVPRSRAVRETSERVTVGQPDAAESALWQDTQPVASRRLLLAAVEVMAERGYHGTTTRHIAQQAGMSPAALYVHYPSKGELLYEISRSGHESLLEAVTAEARSGRDPADALARFTRTYVTWHARYHRTARVIQYELRSLSPQHFRQIAALRRRFEELVQGLIGTGVRGGAFKVADVAGTSLAVLSLGIDVARWYSDRESRTPEQVADLYADLVLRMVT